MKTSNFLLTTTSALGASVALLATLAGCAVEPMEGEAIDAAAEALVGLNMGWVSLSPAAQAGKVITQGGPEAYLEQAYSGNSGQTFDVVPGLADAKCVSLRTLDGDYLRQYNFRVRTSPSENSPLYKNDATFCPQVGLNGKVGNVTFVSKNFPDRVLRARSDGQVWIDPASSLVGVQANEASFVMGAPTLAKLSGFMSLHPRANVSKTLRHWGFVVDTSTISSELDRNDGTFRIVPGLASASCVSFQSKNYPNRYIRHANFRVLLEEGNSDLFRKDATFCPRSALDGGKGYSFTAFNFPTYYLRQRNDNAWIDPVANTTAYRSSASYTMTSPAAGGLSGMESQNAFATRDLLGLASTEAPVAAGRNAVLSNFLLDSRDLANYDLMANAAVNLGSGSLGGYSYGTTRTVPSGMHPGVKQVSPAVTAWASQAAPLSATAAALAVNGTVTKAGNVTTLTGTNAQRNVFALSMADLADPLDQLEVKIVVPANSTVVINVTGSGDLATFDVTGADPSYVLWNFPSASTLTVKNIAFQGSILAPQADVSVYDCDMIGSVIARDIRSKTPWPSGSYKYAPFVGKLN